LRQTIQEHFCGQPGINAICHAKFRSWFIVPPVVYRIANRLD